MEPGLVRALALALSLATAAPLVAQQEPVRPLSVAATLGLSTGASTRDHTGDAAQFSGDLAIALRLREAGSGAWAAALAGGISMAPGHDDVCLPAPNGCLPHFPDVWMLSALGGWETDGGALRLLTGPTWVGGDRFDALGWQTRAALFPPLGGPIALAFSARVTLVPRYEGDAFMFLAVGAGLRLR